jgi:ABC-type sugar transport system substrate-binding protein
MIRFFTGCLFVAWAALWAGCGWASSVVFLNPGLASEPYWSGYSRFMQISADRLGMKLQILYTDRDTHKVLNYAREALQGEHRPDYLVFSNELNVAPQILRLSKGSGVKLLAVNNTFTANQLSMLGDLRATYPDFLGSLEANDEEAGYLVATQLINAAGPVAAGQTIDMIAFSATNTTAVSLKREHGLNRALAEHPQVRLRQVVQAGWRRDRAYEQAMVLLKRYPDTRLVWAASDLMAFGVMDAASELGKQPGKDVLFGTINNSVAALQALMDGRLTALVGGHSAIGGWALVLLSDYDTTDKADRQPIGTRMVRAVHVMERGNGPRDLRVTRLDDYGVDVRQFTHGKTPAGVDYPFIQLDVAK